MLVLEWQDPPFNAGHWVPDQVEAAGGVPVLADAGARSRRLTWEEIGTADVDITIFMPCGFDLEGAVAQAPGLLAHPQAAKLGRIVAVDANAYFSRPGPRVVDGVELLEELLHGAPALRPSRSAGPAHLTGSARSGRPVRPTGATGTLATEMSDTVVSRRWWSSVPESSVARAHSVPVEHHPPVEEYLQTIESLAEEGVPVIQARIAERLGKSAPSVSEMVDRLIADGYVNRSGRKLDLTPEGHTIARGVIRKHRLAERLLVDVIKLPWHLVHEEAGRWEHVISDDVEARLVELLGDPATCPHGNPIPGSANRVSKPPRQVRLSDIDPGQTVRFERLTEEVEMDGAALRYLDDAGFIPGATGTVTTKAPDGTLIVSVGEQSVALGVDLCKRLFVLPL